MLKLSSRSNLRQMYLCIYVCIESYIHDFVGLCINTLVKQPPPNTSMYSCIHLLSYSYFNVLQYACIGVVMPVDVYRHSYTVILILSSIEVFMYWCAHSMYELI